MARFSAEGKLVLRLQDAPEQNEAKKEQENRNKGRDRPQGSKNTTMHELDTILDVIAEHLVAGMGMQRKGTMEALSHGEGKLCMGACDDAFAELTTDDLDSRVLV